MSLSSVAIKRPVCTVMVTGALLVLGLVGFSRLGTDLFPDVAFPVVTVNVPYPGASPKEVESLVTKQIEDEVVSLNGIDRVRSFSREGLSTTIVFFQLGVDIMDAATQVRERVGRVKYKLPAEAKEPIVGRFDVGAHSHVHGAKRRGPEFHSQVRRRQAQAGHRAGRRCGRGRGAWRCEARNSHPS